MNSAVQVTDSAARVLSIDVIKKAFIQLNQLDAKIEQQSRAIACDSHVKQVKVWLQDQERELGIKVEVVASLDCLTEAQQTVLLLDAPGTVAADRYIMFASDIESHQQAINAYEYIVVGLGCLPKVLTSKQKKVCMQIYRSLHDDQQAYLETRFDLQSQDDHSISSAVMSYLAEVSALAIKPVFAQRRDSWQRNLVRKLYPALPWTPTDIHCLIHSARKKA